MLTILWVDDDGRDCWDRYETKGNIEYDERLAPYLDSPDTMVFPHEADELWIPGDEFSSNMF